MTFGLSFNIPSIVLWKIAGLKLTPNGKWVYLKGPLCMGTYRDIAWMFRPAKSVNMLGSYLILCISHLPITTSSNDNSLLTVTL